MGFPVLENKIESNPLFVELKEIADGLGMTVIEARKDIRNATDVHVSLTVVKNGGETSIDDCEMFHRSAQSRLELLIGRDVLSMEVSTPGVQRNIKDIFEFSIFTGRFCRLYCQSRSSWVEGTIVSTDGKSVLIKDCNVVDSGEKYEELQVEFSDIQKARLEYKWETAEDKKRKNAEKQRLERKIKCQEIDNDRV